MITAKEAFQITEKSERFSLLKELEAEIKKAAADGQTNTLFTCLPHKMNSIRGYLIGLGYTISNNSGNTIKISWLVYGNNTDDIQKSGSNNLI